VTATNSITPIIIMMAAMMVAVVNHDLSPAAVGRRLDVLRATYVPESIERARERLVQDEARCRAPKPSLAEGAAKRLAELRALIELTQHLHDR
jgi:hypothetical protein